MTRPKRPPKAQSTYELLIVLFAGVMALIAVSAIIHRVFNSNMKNMSDTLDQSTNAIKPVDVPTVPQCTCSPPQGASGWRCGAYSCKATERLVTTTCTPMGCGASIGVKEEQCVEDSACCSEFEDTNFCGTGGPTPDCAIGERIIQKTCGLDKSTYDCRQDLSEPSQDGTPSCIPHCIGEFSTNEAAAIVNPSLPVICPGDDTSLDKAHGPWSRDRSGVGILTTVLGQGVGVCRHPPSPMPDKKCETYCLNGYLPNPNGLTCDPISCQKGPIALRTSIANEDLPQGTTHDYSYTVPTVCPIVGRNSYITFNIILKEANIQVWNYETSNWDIPSTSTDNNNLFQSFKLFPLGNDRKYFEEGLIKWKASQAQGDQDDFGVKIMALECDDPSMPQNLIIQDGAESLSTDSGVIRSFNVPDQCTLLDESSDFSVSIELNNASLLVYDINADTWSEIANSGPNNRQSLALKYHPLGLESRYFKDNQIAWKIVRTKLGQGNYNASITVDDCHISLCSGAPKEGWVNSTVPTNSCGPVCGSADMTPAVSPEGMACASGENRPMSGTGTISYTHDCANGLGCNGNLPGPTQTHFIENYCYRNGQNENAQMTDIAVACYCQR